MTIRECNELLHTAAPHEKLTLLMNMGREEEFITFPDNDVQVSLLFIYLIHYINYLHVPFILAIIRILIDMNIWKKIRFQILFDFLVISWMLIFLYCDLILFFYEINCQVLEKKIFW